MRRSKRVSLAYSSSTWRGFSSPDIRAKASTSPSVMSRRNSADKPMWIWSGESVGASGIPFKISENQLERGELGEIVDRYFTSELLFHKRDKVDCGKRVPGTDRGHRCVRHFCLAQLWKCGTKTLRQAHA